MDAALVLAFLSGTITFIVEVVKSWVPCKYKDEKGLVIPRRGKKPLHIPNQAVWPTLSMLIGIAIFGALNYNILGIGDYAGSVLTGAGVGTAGGSAGFRIKNWLGSATGGNEETSAQNTGPVVESEPKTGGEI